IRSPRYSVSKWYDEAPQPELPEGRQTLHYGPAPDEELRNLALALVLMWGPSRRLPAEDRLMAFVDDLDHGRAVSLVEDARSAEQIGNAYVRERYEASGHASEFGSLAEMAQAVRHRFPWVDDENVRHLFSQSCYYAWHG